MLRAIILSLVLVLALGMIIPMATEYTEATSVQQTKRKYKKKRRASKYKRQQRYRRSVRRCNMRKYRKAPSCIRFRSWNKRYKKSKRYNRSKRRYVKQRRYTAKRRTTRKKSARKHSAKWWRAYHARKARAKAIAKRKRALRLRRIRLAKKRKASKSSRVRQNRSAAKNRVVAKVQQPAVLPSGDAAPLGWIQNEASNSEMRFNVDGSDGSASLTVLGPAAGKSTDGWRNDTVGGVSTTTLRRTVIDKMIRENGWVENDYQKEIAGKKVYVVVAKSQEAGNRVQSRTFYFTEANGRIYSLATKASKEDAPRIVKQSEKVIESLQQKEKRVQQAKKQ